MQKKVRQGDPLSPYLFLLAVECLHKILSICITQSHCEGLGHVLFHQQKLMHL
jgi:hypothetical protein